MVYELLLFKTGFVFGYLFLFLMMLIYAVIVYEQLYLNMKRYITDCGKLDDFQNWKDHQKRLRFEKFKKCFKRGD